MRSVGPTPPTSPLENAATSIDCCWLDDVSISPRLLAGCAAGRPHRSTNPCAALKGCILINVNWARAGGALNLLAEVTDAGCRSMLGQWRPAIPAPTS